MESKTAILTKSAYGQAVLTAPVQAAHWRSDSDLIQRCQQGDETAWADLVSRYARLVYAIPRRCGLGKEDADLVFEAVFARVLQNLDRLQTQPKFYTWLIDCVHNMTWRRLRRLGQKNEYRQGYSLRDVERQAKPVERAELLRLAVHALDPIEQALLESYLSEARPADHELAARLGIPAANIQERTSKALADLMQRLTVLGLLDLIQS